MNKTILFIALALLIVSQSCQKDNTETDESPGIIENIQGYLSYYEELNLWGVIEESPTAAPASPKTYLIRKFECDSFPLAIGMKVIISGQYSKTQVPFPTPEKMAYYNIIVSSIKPDEFNPDGEPAGIPPASIKQVAEIIEVRYGTVTALTFDDKSYKFSLVNIEENMSDCSETGDALYAYQIHADIRLETDNENKLLRVTSRPCGVFAFPDGSHIDYVQEEIEALQKFSLLNPDIPSFPTNFIYFYGKGTQLKNTPFSIFIGHAYYASDIDISEHPHNDINMIPLVFILTVNR
ncbi:MAG: hypothetical protein LBH04_02290 [Tannerellaceae bacterium]|jgi:hypothetical protein|nr:hypothetical protein [Tannerellaceae bacterium]